jgi:hypothetical protein
MAIENDVRGASEKFYSALNRMLNGDAGPLGDIWSHSATVTTMHPIGGREVGWDQVRGSCPILLCVDHCRNLNHLSNQSRFHLLLFHPEL